MQVWFKFKFNKLFNFILIKFLLFCSFNQNFLLLTNKFEKNEVFKKISKATSDNRDNSDWGNDNRDSGDWGTDNRDSDNRDNNI